MSVQYFVEARVKPGSSSKFTWCGKEWECVGLEPDPVDDESEAIALARELWNNDGADKRHIQYRVRRGGQDFGMFNIN